MSRILIEITGGNICGISTDDAMGGLQIIVADYDNIQGGGQFDGQPTAPDILSPGEMDAKIKSIVALSKPA